MRRWTCLARGLALGLLLAAACGRAPARASTYQGTTLMGSAPDFELSDQAGTPRRLSDFRGQVVVLVFLDSQCQDLCPRLAHDLRDLNTALGDRAGRVALLGVNVNTGASAPADLERASSEWGLDQLAAWHFLGGEPEALVSVWTDYNIAVAPDPQQAGRVMHTAGIFIVDATGRWRWYVSPPGDDEPDTGLVDLLHGRVLELLAEQQG